nr:hypothetical protein Iba_chr14aCG19950 [Ipomoea batatas]GMD84987.1 hypothetical protein Iba_chr14aCG19980 [Ipomoea batatas]GMD88903.1 hypothetical protein Iba_chr14cCG11590 [Ipomoea batatas]
MTVTQRRPHGRGIVISKLIEMTLLLAMMQAFAVDEAGFRQQEFYDIFSFFLAGENCPNTCYDQRDVKCGRAANEIMLGKEGEICTTKSLLYHIFQTTPSHK